jgi:hypothetical protein
VEDYEQIRKAFFVEGLSIRAIHRKLHVDRETICKAIVQPVPQPYQWQPCSPHQPPIKFHQPECAASVFPRCQLFNLTASQ